MKKKIRQIVVSDKVYRWSISKIDANGSINWSYASETIEHPVALTGTANGELMACGSCQSEDF
ncbi:MAG: hypothetical protein AAF639_40805, partial [Chloroflexota bacterium]